MATFSWLLPDVDVTGDSKSVSREREGGMKFPVVAGDDVLKVSNTVC